MRLLLDSGWVKVLAVVAVLAAVIYGGVWVYKIDERRIYGLLETALDYGGIDDRGFRSYRTEGPAAPCTDRASVGSMGADMNGLDGLAVAATIADRYEQEGWTVTRFISGIDFDTGEEATRWLIADTDEVSLIGTFSVGGVELGIRTGPCLVPNGISDSLALQVGTFERDPAAEDLVYGLLDAALGFGGIDATRPRWAVSFPKERGCEGGAYQGNVFAEISTGNGLGKAAIIADRYEEQGWSVQRYADGRERESSRWVIATTDGVSVQVQLNPTGAVIDVRAGPCIVNHSGSEISDFARPVQLWETNN